MSEHANEAEPESPCIAVCVPDPVSGYCLGCFRTLDEIAAWPEMSADEKRAVLEKLIERERRGGMP